MTPKMILTTTNNKKNAKKMAKFLLENNLANCVQILKNKSFYIWEGKICKQKEFILFIKSLSNFDLISQKIKLLNNYDTPEILSIKLDEIDEKYKKWLMEDKIEIKSH